MDEYLAIIKIFAGTFAPRGFAMCQGQMLPISQNQALFSLMGTIYGGNGSTTFQLPNLNGRVPIGVGQSTVGGSYVNGQVSGTESVTLTQLNLPSHAHTMPSVNGTGTQAGTAIAANGDATTPQNNYLALSPKIGSGPNATQLKTYATAAAGTPVNLGGGAITTTSNSGATGVTGSNSPIVIMQPYLAVTYIIVLSGIFPSRN